jgi:hypothetical protein
MAWNEEVTADGLMQRSKNMLASWSGSHLIMESKTLQTLFQQVDGNLASVPQRLHNLGFSVVCLTAFDNCFKLGNWQIWDKLAVTKTLVVPCIGEDS